MTSASSMVDWDLAGRTGRRLMSAGPTTTREEAAAVVRELHEAAAVAVAHVEKLTGLRPVPGGPVPEVAVVDRPGWVDANTSGMAALLDPLVQALTEKQDTRPGAIATAIGSRATGVQVGGLLAFLSCGSSASTRSSAPAAGCCWSRRTSWRPSGSWTSTRPTSGSGCACTRSRTAAVHRGAVAARLPRVADRRVRGGHRPHRRRAARAAAGRPASVADAVRGGDGESEGLMAMIQRPAQREVLDRLMALMTLVEGHADYVMDAVGPDVVPTVTTIRKRFAERRQGGGPLDRGCAGCSARAEDQPVRRGPGLRRRGGGPGRHGRLQPRLDRPRPCRPEEITAPALGAPRDGRGPSPPDPDPGRPAPRSRGRSAAPSGPR